MDWIYLYDIDAWFIPCTGIYITGAEFPEELLPITKVYASWN